MCEVPPSGRVAANTVAHNRPMSGRDSQPELQGHNYQRKGFGPPANIILGDQTATDCSAYLLTDILDARIL